MAMVDAVRGGKHIRVSHAAYETIYKNKGYRIIGNGRNKLKEEYDAMSDLTMEEPESVDVDSIPVSDMTKQQLVEYAKKHNIDTHDAKNVNDARRIIKEEIRKRKMQ